MHALQHLGGTNSSCVQVKNCFCATGNSQTLSCHWFARRLPSVKMTCTWKALIFFMGYSFRQVSGISSLRVARVHVQDTGLASFHHSSIIPRLLRDVTMFFPPPSQPCRSHRLFNAGFTCWPNEHDCLMVSPTELLASAEECWEGR